LISECNKREKEEQENKKKLFDEDGTLLDAGKQLKLNEFYGKKDQKWKLCWKATRDGFSADRFHELCDNKGASLTVIKSSDGWLFGGYTSQSWTSAGVWKLDPGAWLFTLTNVYGIPAAKFPVTNEKQAILGYPTYGPTFGAHDIYISDKSNIHGNSHTQFPNAYRDSTGKGRTLFTGMPTFLTSDIEIFIAV